MSWHDDGTLATSRATGRLFAWLRNYGTVWLDGAPRTASIYWEGAPVAATVTAVETASAISFTMTTNAGSWCTLSADLK